jgi:hypothetical protein
VLNIQKDLSSRVKVILSSSLNTKETTTYDAGNIGLDLGQAQQCSRVTPVNGNPMPPSTWHLWASCVETDRTVVPKSIFYSFILCKGLLC